jgi:hypothetical protein
MLVAYFAIFFLLVFLLALGLSALFFSLRDRRRRARVPLAALAALADPPGADAADARALSDFERSVLRDVYGMSEEEIRFSETLLRYREQTGRTYVTSEDRPDGFFQA